METPLLPQGESIATLVKTSEDEVTVLKISPLRFRQMTNSWLETRESMEVK